MVLEMILDLAKDQCQALRDWPRATGPARLALRDWPRATGAA